MEHDPTAPTHSGVNDLASIELQSRVAALERAVAAHEAEVRTRRLVVVDDTGAERLITAVGESFAEVRLSVGGRRRRLDVVLVAAREPSDPRAGATAGVEVWFDGDHLGGFTVSADR
jgi:hypothetical protein